MKALSCCYDSRNDGYILCHTALLIFTITVMIPMNFQLTRLPPVVSLLIFSLGFLSLFMIVRNEMVGGKLLKHLSMGERIRLIRPSNSLFQVQRERNSTLSEDPHPDANSIKNCEDLMMLLHNFVEELRITYSNRMNITTQDSFRKLQNRLLEITNEGKIK